MKFIINGYENFRQYFWQQKLIYIPEEHSFYMPNITKKMDIELIVNAISLIVNDGIVVNVSGFCGLDNSMKSNYQVPEFSKGILRIEHDLEYGFAYSINEKDFSIHINTQIGWVCIGNPKKKGSAVEFINNCVAVIDNNENFVSLWLKPEKLPDI